MENENNKRFSERAVEAFVNSSLGHNDYALMTLKELAMKAGETLPNTYHKTHNSRTNSLFQPLYYDVNIEK